MHTYHSELEHEDYLGTITGVEPIIIYYTCHAGCKGRTDGKYGPAIEPDEPAYIEIDHVTGDNGREVLLTTAQENAFEELINEELASNDGDEDDYGGD